MTGSGTVSGIVGVVMASVFWGSNFIVCKGYQLPEDGVHFAFLMSIGALLVGFITLMVSSVVEDGDFKAVLSPLGLLGGSFWACGNFLTVPIIERTGLGIGLALWAGTNMIVAFVVGSVGLEFIGLGLAPEELGLPVVGVVGVFLALCALAVLANIKLCEEEESTAVTDTSPGGEQGRLSKKQPETQNETESPSCEEDPLPGSTRSPSYQFTEPSSNFMVSGGDSSDENKIHETLVEAAGRGAGESNSREGDGYGDFEGDGESKGSRRKHFLVGIGLGILAGTCYGFMFVPLTMWNSRVLDNGHIFGDDLPSDTKLALQFFFSQFAGIFMTTSVGFLLYGAVIKKNQPKLVPAHATLPSVLSGVLWALGCSGGMLATVGFGNAIGFPLSLNTAILVNSTWSLVYFREIRGRKNLLLFCGAFLLISISSILLSLSKS